MSFSLTEMVAGASIVAGVAGSIFKNPAKAGTDTISSAQLGIDYLMEQVSIIDPTYIPPTYPDPDPAATLPISLSDHITSSVSGITAAISAKTLSVASDLKIALIAADHQNAAKAIDAITSKNLAAMPDQIAVKFPDVTANQNTVTDTAFTPLTHAAPHMDAAASVITAEFDNIGYMVPFFTAVNSIPGVTQMTTGEALLNYIGSTPDKTLIDAAFIASNTIEFIDGLKTAFSNVGDHTTDMASGFTAIVDSANGAMATAMSIIGGNSLVSMLSSPDVFVQSILGKVVDTSTIDFGAIDMKKAVESSAVALPGTEAFILSAKGSTANGVTSSDNLIPATAIIVPENSNYQQYTGAEINEMYYTTDEQLTLCEDLHKQAAEWMDINLEKWKISVDYRQKKIKAGYTKDVETGISTDATALAEWQPLLVEAKRRLAEYNAGIGGDLAREYVKYDEMYAEWQKRARYGKFPYTYLESIGTIVSLNEKTTHLDTTK